MVEEQDEALTSVPLPAVLPDIGGSGLRLIVLSLLTDVIQFRGVSVSDLEL